MKKNIYTKDFLLLNDYGKKLYHEVAAVLPIIDPHNHIDPAALASNKKFENIYQLWVQNDPYKHRAMRIFGIAEELITGDKPDEEKFLAWATCFPHTVGNPIFHWSCMELKHLFQVDEMLSPQNAEEIWQAANALLADDLFGSLNILKSFGVQMLCTSDDLTDSLQHHLQLAKEQSTVTCLPSLRSDTIIAFGQPSFLSWLNKLQSLTGLEVTSLAIYKNAIVQRLHFFNEAGCLLSDHSFDSGWLYTSCDDATAIELFSRLLQKEVLNEQELLSLQSHVLDFLGKEYAQLKWGMQLHIGAYRYTSSVLRDKLGPAGGYACIGNTTDVQSLCAFLDGLDKNAALPKTILYNLNPADNAMFASITGSYAADGVQGKIQFGPAWWYNDHAEGIQQQLLALSSYGLLSTSIGMTTDSRSILSFVRHDYYRRIFCNLIGSWVEEGKLQDDWDFIANLVEKVSFSNVKNWLKK